MMYDNDSNEWLNGFVYGIVLTTIVIVAIEALAYGIWEILH